MNTYAFQVFYIGRNYQGFQRQPNGQTVENHLEYAFIMSDLIYSFSDNEYRSCSRTDQGVNALGNVFSLQCSKKPILPQINSFLPTDIIVWAFTEVEGTFNPRSKVIKQYRYYLDQKLIPESCDIDRIFEYKGRFDFTAFLKKHGAGMDYSISTIDRVNVVEKSEYLVIDIFGDRFGREQIRRMVGFLIQEKYCNTSPNQYLDYPDQVDIYSAPAEYLVLMSIQYHPQIKWNIDIKLYQLIEYQFSSLLDQIVPLTVIKNVIEDFKNLLESPNMGQ